MQEGRTGPVSEDAAVPVPAGRRALPARTRTWVWMVLILLALVALWEGYKVVGKAVEGIVPLPVRPDDTSMPHVWSMIAVLFVRRRPGDPILLLVLLEEAAFTFREALIGFTVGSTIGFVLAVTFTRSRLLERAFMPYVVASQTVPLLAIAPIVVIWGAKIGWPVWVSVSVIASYLVFFPVTINTLRGLRSPDPTTLELMRSYAATPTETLWKVQVPASLPYVFSALRIAATASVVGALVGELPSSLNQGLGRAILSFMYAYITNPERLFAAVLVAAVLSMAFVGVIGLAERLALRNRREAT